MASLSYSLLSVLVTVTAILHVGDAASVSFNGHWGPVTDINQMVLPEGVTLSNSSLCKDRFLCSPNNLTWILDRPSVLYDKVNGCEALLKKGITQIYYHGDSYMRQIYAAMLITLNGDYEYGSLANSTLSPHCRYHFQFNEKGCGTRSLNHNGRVCDGKVHLNPIFKVFESQKECSKTNGSVVLWSYGNHRVIQNTRKDWRAGVNNATAYSKHYKEKVCPSLENDLAFHNNESSYPRSKAPYKCSVWWISTHYRMKQYYWDESIEMVKAYNEGMRQFFDSGSCADVNYIDVYNMTQRLGVGNPQEGTNLTYDQVHWGMEVNLWKAQNILNAILR